MRTALVLLGVVLILGAFCFGGTCGGIMATMGVCSLIGSDY